MWEEKKAKCEVHIVIWLWTATNYLAASINREIFACMDQRLYYLQL